MAKTLIWLLIHSLLLGVISPQTLLDLKSTNSSRICKGQLIRSVMALKNLEGCAVVLGSLEIFIEIARKGSFGINTTFSDLREITEYLVIYRVRGLESVRLLFPNLTRIRGMRLLNNFALIVYDNSQLREIGLYSLLKIDRGGVIMWDLPQACFMNTIDWKVLAPNARHVISPTDRQVQCSIPCSCSSNASLNHCWNNRKCQLFLDGPEADQCNEQCLGCRKTNKDICFLCRHFTYQRKCVTQCPSDTILLPDNQYCVTEDECHKLDRWVFNNTCVAECPIDYRVKNDTKHAITCESCIHCEITCGDIKIQSLSSIQDAERCVYVNGSLTIHVRAIPGAMADLRSYLGHIQEVSHYISIEGSDIASLDFLSSLRVIKGEKLKEDKYAIDIEYNSNLQTLFTSTVTKNLKIKNGTARFDHNPILCMSKIDEVKSRLQVKPTSIEIPEGSNGYSGVCNEVSFDFKITLANESSVLIKFSPVQNHDRHYSALYVRLPPGVHTTVVPETCSEFEWHATDVPAVFDKGFGVAELNALQPASSYALCIEIYDPDKKRLFRSNIFNFTTPVGIPEPPFIVELVASDASDVVVVRWVDHKDYTLHIDYYQLDVALIEKNSRSLSEVDYCKLKEDLVDVDYTRHALVRRPPKGYNRGCESMCGILASVTPGAMVEEYFDVCDDIQFGCDNQESIISSNSSFGNYVQTLILLNISSPRSSFQVGGLAPFSDYKFRLRACSGGQCSRYAKGVVRTFRLKNADIPTITYEYANQFGQIFVRWNPPNVTNGPILSYTIEVLPRLNINNLMPQSWCVSADETKLSVQSVIVPKYLVRVCVKTLASSNSCSDWRKITSVTESKMILLWAGMTCGILIYIASCVVGWFKRRYSYRSDVVPLVDSSSSSRVESEPPGLMLSDFVPFHTIPLD